MKKALIAPNDNNRVIQVEAVIFPVAYPLFWVECADNVQVGWTYANDVFSAPAIPDPVIPSVVSMRQARLALLQSGYLQSVNNYMETSSSAATKIEWEYAAEVDRNSPLVSSLAVMLGLSSTQLDGLFTLAASL